MQLRAVAFDVDGTLYPNSLMYLASTPFFLSRVRLITNFRAVRHELRRVRPIDDFYATQSSMLAQRLGVSAEEAGTIIDRRIYRDWEQVLKVVPAFPGVRSLVAQLRNAGFRLGVLSDFPLGEKLHRLGLDGLWDVRVSSETVGYLKPNPEPFQALLDELGTGAEETLYIGNNYAYDIEGARALGMRTAHIRVKPLRSSKADLSFFWYKRLANWLIKSYNMA